MKKPKNRPVVNVVFQGMIDEFLTRLEVANYSNDSVKSYKSPLKSFFLFLMDEGIERVQEVTHDLMDKYRLKLVRRELKNSSLELYIRVVRFLFQHLESTGEIFMNPVSEIVVPRLERHLQYVPTIDEMEHFLDMDTPTPQRIRDKAFFETAYSCGARVTELRMLDLQDFNQDKKELRIFGKGRKERIIPIGKYAERWLDKYIKKARPILLGEKENKALFLTRDGNRVTRVGIQKQVQFRREEAGLPEVSMHAIRRACATHMLQGGASPVGIQKLLGHAGLESLSQYLSVSIAELKETHERNLR